MSLLRSFVFAAASSVLVVPAMEAATFYLSPTGSDGNSGSSTISPFKTFAKAFGAMRAADELVLLDGVYGQSEGTGYINSQGTGSGQAPSGSGRNAMTVVRALNPGKVRIRGPLLVGSSTRKDRFIRLDGLTFDGGGHLANCSYIHIRQCGFQAIQGQGGGFGIGTNDGEWGNDHILLEDSWVWGRDERILLLVYRSEYVVFRRVVFRQDGCYTASLDCGSNPGNQMAGSTVYNSHHVSFQNVLSLDALPGPAGYQGGADFYTAWHDNYIYPWHSNEWLGTITLNSGLSSGYGYYLDAIAAPQQPMATWQDIVAWNTNSPFYAQLNCGNCPAHNLQISNATLKASAGDGFRISSNMASGNHLVRNLVLLGTGNRAVNSVQAPSYVDVSGTWSSAYSQAPCSTGCLTLNPLTSGAMKYPVRVEAGSALKGTGAGGADYGARVVTRYGADGAFSGESGYNVMTQTALWPWPHEDRIKKEMCADSGVTRGFCGASTLTRYVWEAAGQAMPPDLGGGSAPCDVNASGGTDVVDVQLAVNQALGVGNCTADINRDGRCDVVDVQRVVNAALTQTCMAP